MELTSNDDRDDDKEELKNHDRENTNKDKNNDPVQLNLVNEHVTIDLDAEASC